MTQIITLAGTTGKDATFKTTQSGQTLCSFSVAVNTGYGDNKQTTWWDVTRWGKGADKLAELLVKGTKVTVVGEVGTREHDGKTYLQCRADHVTLQGGRQADGGQRSSGGGNQQSYRDEPLDDEVPF
ncbi:hypothetical protein TomTYG75_06780 [Sphingobium sp. TomTYG75]